MSNKTYNNPWAGLSSYQDPEGSDVQLKFCGRDNESFDVMRLIDDNIFVTLYGKSGTGKTSLLNAGVFPRLRREQYLPVSIRLGMDAIDMSFQQCILTRISQALQSKGTQTTVEVVPMPTDEQSTEYLWSYFARTRFMAADGSSLFPVLVFDQFEEVFRNRRDEAETLLRQIHFMMDENHALGDRMVDGQPYQYDFNFRFVASIREDDLYRLEDSIDNCYLPELKRCRYRLRSLSEQGASDVILIPGEGLFKTEEQKDIVDKIVGKSRNEDGSISTNIISLLCSRIYADFQRSGADYISPTLVDSFLKGNPFEQFYNEATRGFSNREKNYIEDHLVDSTGRRNSVPEADFLLHVKNGAVLLEGTQKILQRTSVSSDGSNYRIELIHDSFCEPLVGQKEKRGQRRKLRILALGIIVACCVFGGVWFYLDQIEKANTMSKDIALITTAERARMYLEQGDSYSARVTLLDIFKDDIEDISPAYLPMAEAVLREACKHNTAILKGHYNYLTHVRYSSDGKFILTASVDGTMRLWNALTGECLKIFTVCDEESFLDIDVDFCQSDKSIISCSEDGALKVWDIESGKISNSLNVQKEKEETCSMWLSPNKSFFIMRVGKNYRLYNVSTLKMIKEFKDTEKWGNICWYPDGKCFSIFTQNHEFLKYNLWTGQTIRVAKHNDDAELIAHAIDPKGEKIGGAFGYKDGSPGYARIWDDKTGRCLQTLKGGEYWVNGVTFSADSKNIVTTSMMGPVRIWDVSSGACLDIMEGHPFASFGPIYSPNRECIATGSADFSARIWDVPQQEDSIGIFPVTLKLRSISYFNEGKDLLLSTYDSISLYDVATKKWKETLYKQDSIVLTYLSPRSDVIAVRLSNNRLGLLDVSSRKIKMLKGFKDVPYSISFSSDGKQVVYASLDSVIHINDVNTGRQIHTIPWDKKVSTVLFVDNGKRLLVRNDSTISIWSVADSKCIKTWIVPEFSPSYSIVKLSPDRKHILCSNESTMFIWELESGKLISTLAGHISSIYACAFSPDGKYVVSTSHDTMVKLWDWKSGICLTSQRLNQYLFACYSNDGRHVALLSRSGKEIRILDFPPLQQLIDETRERFKNRKLSGDERRKYYLE